jgi:predicted Zn-dependent protease
MFLRFSRDDEREADRLGVEYAARSGFDPRQVSNFFEVLGRLSAANDRETIPGWLSTHPDPPERVKSTRMLAEQWISMLGLTEERLTVNRDGFLRAIDGIVFGNNPREGFMEGSRFYHPDLRFQIDFPAGWIVDNTREAVVALEPRRAAQLQLTMPQVPAGTTAENYAKALASRGVTPQEIQNARIHGYNAVLATYILQAQDGTVGARAAFIEFRNQILQIIGVTPDLRRFGGSIDDSIRSFDSLTDQRVLSVQPDRLQIYAAQQGDTLAAIAERQGNPRVSADDLAILNRLAVGQPIAAGRLLKIVEKGY